MMIKTSNRTEQKNDWLLAILVMILAAYGVLCVAAATFSTSSDLLEDGNLNYIVTSYYGMRQSIFFLISPVVLGVVACFPYEFIRRHTKIFYGIACLLLAVALGGKATGVKAWIDILWGYTLQPSEFVKLACIIVGAKYLETNEDPLGSWNSIWRLGILMGFPWALTLAQGEMGSVLVMIFIFAVMMYFGGIRMRVMFLIIALGIAFIALLYSYLVFTGSDNYRLERILSFIDPSMVDEGAVYQVNNSKIAIGSGGLSGVGAFTQGSLSQLDYVPEDWTDFIFASIGEIFGFYGTSFVLIMYMLIIARMLWLAYYTMDRFGQMIIIGVMAMLLFHVFENVGMTTGLTPVTGIPLPFLSYGGSNLVTNMIGIGMVLNVVKNRSNISLSDRTLQTQTIGRYMK